MQQPFGMPKARRPCTAPLVGASGNRARSHCGTGVSEAITQCPLQNSLSGTARSSLDSSTPAYSVRMATDTAWSDRSGDPLDHALPSHGCHDRQVEYNPLLGNWGTRGNSSTIPNGALWRLEPRSPISDHVRAPYVLIPNPQFSRVSAGGEQNPRA